MRAPVFCCLAIVALIADGLMPSVGHARPRVPDWVGEVMRSEGPSQAVAGEVTPAEILYNARDVEVRRDGRILSTHTYVARIHTRDGRFAASLARVYFDRSDKVQSARAWLAGPDGQVREYGRRDFIDRVRSSEDLYSDCREIVVTPTDDVVPGSLFACSLTILEDRVTSQDQWRFSANLPVRYSRYALQLPAGWRVEPVLFNDPGVSASLDGVNHAWEARDLPAIVSESLEPSSAARHAGLAVSLFPPDNSGRRAQRQSFGTWGDVAAYMAEIVDEAAAVDNDVERKARELTAGVRSEMEIINTIARFVQGLTYVSIQSDMGTGGGLVPHAAPRVLKCGYGDCKDKATLMRALLKARGIESYLVAVALGDSSVVLESWPSLLQFDHAIVAVRVVSTSAGPSVDEHAELGRLWFFDPTNAATVPGDLPRGLQGNLALLADREVGGLVRLPILPAATSLQRRTIDAVVSLDTTISGTVSETTTGQEAAELRRVLSANRVSDHVRLFSSWVRNPSAGAGVQVIRVEDEANSGTIDLAFKFLSSRYAQVTEGNVLLFRPVVLARWPQITFMEGSRTQPVRLSGRVLEEHIHVTIPSGHVAEELPPGIDLREDFGRFTAVFRQERGVLVLERKLQLETTTVPIDDFERVQRFFAAIAGTEQARLVFVRSPE